jgi:uncharacterized protein YecE (DUF72 family)
MKLFIGTSGYSYPAWKGKFYPKALPAAQFLKHYAETFRTVEINSTFFALPKAATLETWAGQVGADFRFSFKATKRITHMQPLVNKGEVVASMLDALGTLESRLGVLLFQTPPTLKKDLPRLQAFLESLPKTKTRLTFEFRHQTWFDDEVFGLLREHGIPLCLADADDELDVPFVSTGKWGYLRLRRLDYDDAALKDWLKKMTDQGWSEAWVYFKHEDEANGPRLAQRMIELNG